MNILDQIIQHKSFEVAERKAKKSVTRLEQSLYFTRAVVSMKEHVTRKDKTGIIAEFKRKSPSKGIINATAPVVATTQGYVAAGASALSILTDFDFFGGTTADLELARNANACPILRKDFIIDEYQIVEAKAMGADAILLIAAALKPEVLKRLAEFAKSLSLEVLMEVHSEQELESNLSANVDLIGVNNRNLKSFVTDIELSARLVSKIPASVVKISESGIDNPQTIIELRNAGYQGFLMGQSFMQHNKPEVAFQDFVNRLRQLEIEK